MARFHTNESSHRPYVILNAAMTLDGKIATRTGDSRLSSIADLREVHKLRSGVDAVMIGIGTQINDDPRLTTRLAKGKNPMRVVVDSLARTSPRSRILVGEGRTVIAVTERAPEDRVAELRAKGAIVIRCGTKQVNLKRLLTKLQETGVRRILLEGGGNLNYSMLTGRMVDEIRVTIAPFVVGGDESKTLVEGLGVSRVSRAIRLSLLRTRPTGNELRVSYRVRN